MDEAIEGELPRILEDRIYFVYATDDRDRRR